MLATYVKRVFVVHYLERRVARKRATKARWAHLRQATTARNPRYWGRVDGVRRRVHRYPEMMEEGEPVAIMGATRHGQWPDRERMFIEHIFSMMEGQGHALRVIQGALAWWGGVTETHLRGRARMRRT